MLIEEFVGLNPAAFSNYAGGFGNINVLISSSVTGSENVPIPPFHIQGLTVPFKSSTGVDISTALNEVTSIKFDYAGAIREAEILDRQKRSTHYYLRVRDIVLQVTASKDSEGNPREVLSELVFTPYLTTNFNNSDFNPLLSNSDKLKENAVAMVVDRNTNQVVPSNIDAIIANTAQKAQIQNCSYTKAGLINARYKGTKLNSGSIEGDDPALGLVSFEASIHPIDSDVATIKGTQLSDREVVTVKFNSKRIETGSEFKYQTFPSSSNILFTEEGSRVVRLANQKVYSVDKNEVYTSDESGIVSSVL